MVAKTALSIDFPKARLDYFTRFLTVEISSDRVAQISDKLQQQCGNPIGLDS